ncbi:hypothetical protein BaRGS_00029506, partial [Batillaria attramentaria]
RQEIAQFLHVAGVQKVGELGLKLVVCFTADTHSAAVGLRKVVTLQQAVGDGREGVGLTDDSISNFQLLSRFSLPPSGLLLSVDTVAFS